MKKHAFMMLVGVVMLTVLAACGGGNGEEASGEVDSTNDEDAEATGGDSDSLTIAGSSAMQPLVGAVAEVYQEENPDASIDVQAGGSGAGLSQVSEGQVDIGNSDLFAEEEDEINADELVDHRVAVVGMGPVVHPDAGVEDLSQDELIDVWRGEITNWSELGGEDQEITLVNRPDSSGTRATFVDFALEGEEPAEGITEDSSNTVRQIVSETPGAIGYLAFSYFDDSISSMSVDGVEPTPENVQTGDFPIWAYQHSYTNGETEGLAQDFLDFMMSDEIQDTLVPEQGYIPVTQMEVERDAEGEETPVE
ncbi:phosphate ABC transporter substrate-binding protein PstS family protein [Natribacillus halophilus]|uniref:Phosphate-binding protein n=1 Tax=Natribacillus halophilus TaxID=549003 RepID=A0A1G8RXP0_9BACI|nr:phosphate ABC transporter substrate-binding protein PstS family protein [Natribacillus halophilus]SDJ21706.1 phosphate ABC transporter substrate-binding protein, PhoT family [Natribacillus halophilus]